MAQNNYNRVLGEIELKRQLERVGSIPKRFLTKAAKAGMKNPLKDAKANAPYETGMLEKGIKAILEKKPRKKTKSVYQLVFDRTFNPIFQKEISPEGKGKFGGKKETGYYPISMEYGFKRDPKFGGYREGEFFITHAVEKNRTDSYKKVINTILDQIDKLT